jgi:hypothetical protein
MPPYMYCCREKGQRWKVPYMYRCREEEEQGQMSPKGMPYQEEAWHSGSGHKEGWQEDGS